MATPRPMIMDGKKFMWDGKEYGNAAEARTAKEVYERDEFETQVVEEEGTFHVYTRRVVGEVVVESSPAT